MTNPTRLTAAQNLIVDLAIASLLFLQDAATEYECSVEQLDEERLREFALKQSKTKKRS